MKSLSIKTISKVFSEHRFQTVFYVDKLCFYVDANTKLSVFNRIKKWNKNNTVLPSSLPHNPQYNKKVEIFQPTDRQLKKLHQLAEQGIIKEYVINYIELAIDFRSESLPKVYALRTFFHKHFVCNPPRSKPYFRKEEGTHYFFKRKDMQYTYYVDDCGRKSDAPGLHLEVRLKTAKLVKQHNIFTFNDILEFDHTLFWDQRIQLYRPDFKKLGHILHQQSAKRERCISDTALNKKANKFWRYCRVLQQEIVNNPDLLHGLKPLTEQSLSKELGQAMKKKKRII